MGGFSSKMKDEIFGSLFDDGEGEVKPLQDNVAKELYFANAMKERLQNIKNIYDKPKSQVGSFLFNDPLDPGGQVGIGVDSGPWRDETGETHSQGVFDNIASNLARYINPKGAQTRQDLYDAANRIHDPIQLKSGAAIPAADMDIYEGGLAPDLSKSRAVNEQRINSAIQSLSKREKNALMRMKLVHPGTDSTIDQFIKVDSLFNK